MKKANCYPIEISVLYLCVSLLCIWIEVDCFIRWRNNSTVIELIAFVCLMSICPLSLICVAFHLMQTLYVKDGKLVLTTPFYKIKELDINSCRYSVISLGTKINRYYSRDKWICIYAQGETNLFDEGLSNSRKYNRIQLIYNDKNLAFVKEILEKENPDEND